LTAKEFMQRIEAYYGDYTPGQRPIIAAYLSRRGERYLDLLLPHVIEGFSSTYKSQPDVAIFEQYRGDVTDKLRLLPPPGRKEIEDHSDVITDEERLQMQSLLKDLAVKMNTRRKDR
jgi:hypothetical protein